MPERWPSSNSPAYFSPEFDLVDAERVFAFFPAAFVPGAVVVILDAAAFLRAVDQLALIMSGGLALGDGAVAFATGFADRLVLRAVAALLRAGFVRRFFGGLGFAIGVVGGAECVRSRIAGLAFVVARRFDEVVIVGRQAAFRRRARCVELRLGGRPFHRLEVIDHDGDRDAQKDDHGDRENVEEALHKLSPCVPLETRSDAPTQL